MSLFARAAAMCLAGVAGAAAHGRQQVEASQEIQDARKKTTFSGKFQRYKLGEVLNLAEDVAVFRFLTPNPDDEFDLPACSTLMSQWAQGANRVEQVQRQYTPITPRGTKGYFDLLVKKQDRGRMTEALFSLTVGDTMEFRVVYHKLKYMPNQWKEIGLIGGGTGLTPLLQVIRESLQIPDDKTKLTLLFGNQTPSKILLKGILDDLAEKSGYRFKPHYVVNRLEPGDQDTFEGYIGHINKQNLKETMPDPALGTEALVLICGPDLMLHQIAGVPLSTLNKMSGGLPQQPVGGAINNIGSLGGVLADLGYRSEQVYRF